MDNKRQVQIIGTGSCFLAKTAITMADGSQKNIEDMRIGDTVKAYDLVSENKVEALIIDVFHHPAEEMGEYFIVINDKLRVTPYHPMYANKEWFFAGGLVIGDILLNPDGMEIIYSIRTIYEQETVFDLLINGPKAYIADDIVVPTKMACLAYFGLTVTRPRVRIGSDTFYPGG
jgi:hypothetical protein